MADFGFRKSKIRNDNQYSPAIPMEAMKLALYFSAVFDNRHNPDEIHTPKK